jgi:hypothetical protein
MRRVSVHLLATQKFVALQQMTLMSPPPPAGITYGREWKANFTELNNIDFLKIRSPALNLLHTDRVKLRNAFLHIWAANATEKYECWDVYTKFKPN